VTPRGHTCCPDPSLSLLCIRACTSHLFSRALRLAARLPPTPRRHMAIDGGPPPPPPHATNSPSDATTHPSRAGAPLPRSSHNLHMQASRSSAHTDGASARTRARTPSAVPHTHTGRFPASPTPPGMAAAPRACRGRRRGRLMRRQAREGDLISRAHRGRQSSHHVGLFGPARERVNARAPPWRRRGSRRSAARPCRPSQRSPARRQPSGWS